MFRSPYMRRHREELVARYDVAQDFEKLEESCIPSYLHRNPLAARVAWQRLEEALRQHAAQAPDGPVLDFGAGSGILARLLPPAAAPYAFVEHDDALAADILAGVAGSARHTAKDLPEGRFAAVFALDSLEHNDDIKSLLDALARTLRPDGVLILSGPTENALYRLGRRIAGFSGHYHKTTIHDIEAMAAAGAFRRRAARVLPLPLLPLFRISTWSRR